jgi:hypothetical protein
LSNPLLLFIGAASALLSGRFGLSVRPHFELVFLITTEGTENTEEILVFRMPMHFVKNALFILQYIPGYWLPCFYPDKELLIKFC